MSETCIISPPRQVQEMEDQRLTRRTPEEIAQIQGERVSQMRNYMEQIQPILSRVGITSTQVIEQAQNGVVIVSGITQDQRASLKDAINESSLGIVIDDKSDLELIE
ncbi:hypothetical protein KJ652_03725 [Patescibacteria group bacterium]|nr:hypothetical protein [Patescibacteria group bacterium]MBU1123676.1 hypothetical protein [Patescibacteria group bacterium]